MTRKVQNVVATQHQLTQHIRASCIDWSKETLHLDARGILPRVESLKEIGNSHSFFFRAGQVRIFCRIGNHEDTQNTQRWRRWFRRWSKCGPQLAREAATRS